eukprot:570887-Karenia_brevis.AAC.1
MVSATKEKPADTSTDSRLRFALQRRGVAMHMARILSFHVHEDIVNWFQTELDRDPLPGHSKVT